METFPFIFNTDIFRKLFIPYLLLTLIPISLISIFAFKASEQIINVQVSKSNRHTLTQIEKNIDTLLDDLTGEVNIYNQNSQLEPALKQSPILLFNRLKNIESVESQMFKYSLTADKLQQEAILIGTNEIVYTSPYGTTSITATNIQHQEWYRRMLHNPEQIVWLNTHPSFFIDHQDEKVFTAIKALQNNNFSNNFYGILILSVKESSLYDIYKDSLDRGNQIFIIDAEGNLISHSVRPKLESKTELKQLMNLIKNKTRDYQILSFNKAQYLCNYKKIDEINWYIINTIPLSVLSQDIKALGFKILLIFLLFSILSIIATIIISRRIAVPLLNLCNHVKSIHSIKTDPKGTHLDEISLLTTEYDHIILELEQTISSLVKEQEEKRKAELQALQMQINPHFLYNTLNSIKCLTWTGKTELIEPTISALVRLLEQTINKGSELISIKEEMDNVRNYIYIQNIRTCNLIGIQYQIDNELIHYMIPKLLLQPVIENAIFHGIEPKNNQGSITIYISTIEEQIQIEIIDNGVGMDDATISSLFISNQKATNRFSGIGIQNVAERLKLHFGQGYGVKIQSEIGIGTSVTLNLPKIP